MLLSFYCAILDPHHPIIPGSAHAGSLGRHPLKTDSASLWEQFLTTRPWARQWWRPAPGEWKVLFWIILIHATALVGLIMTPIPSWPIALATLGLTWLGGIGTTVCYHRSLAHRAVKLNPVVRHTLTFFAVLNGSGAPATWSANHRLHHANSDTVDDVSSPMVGGFWWAHLRWIWQAGQAPMARYCPDLNRPEYRIWNRLQIPVILVSFFGGAVFGLVGFFWLGAIRLVFSLHAQCFVNSVCHLGEKGGPANDTSKNVAWLSVWHLFQGENWHANHHAYPWCARLGLTRAQIDVGWWTIVVLEKLGLADSVRRPKDGAVSLTGNAVFPVRPEPQRT